MYEAFKEPVALDEFLEKTPDLQLQEMVEKVTEHFYKQLYYRGVAVHKENGEYQFVRPEESLKAVGLSTSLLEGLNRRDLPSSVYVNAILKRHPNMVVGALTEAQADPELNLPSKAVIFYHNRQNVIRLEADYVPDEGNKVKLGKWWVVSRSTGRVLK